MQLEVSVSQGIWPSWVKAINPSIAFMELFPIVIAVELWGGLMANKRVKFWTDNQSVVAIVNRQTSKCPHIMSLVRKLVLAALHANIQFKAAYVEGTLNGISDALSRFQTQRFRQLAPRADHRMTPPPDWAC